MKSKLLDFSKTKIQGGCETPPYFGAFILAILPGVWEMNAACSRKTPPLQKFRGVRGPPVFLSLYSGEIGHEKGGGSEEGRHDFPKMKIHGGVLTPPYF